MLFSATLDKDVDSLVKKYLKNPVTHSLANEKSTAGNMTHHVLIMEQSHKDLITSQIAARKGKSIFFVRTKHGADKLTKRMNEAGVAVGALHGGKTQAQRSRVLEAFKSGATNALSYIDDSASLYLVASSLPNVRFNIFQNGIRDLLTLEEIRNVLSKASSLNCRNVSIYTHGL